MQSQRSEWSGKREICCSELYGIIAGSELLANAAGNVRHAERSPSERRVPAVIRTTFQPNETKARGCHRRMSALSLNASWITTLHCFRPQPSPCHCMGGRDFIDPLVIKIHRRFLIAANRISVIPPDDDSAGMHSSRTGAVACVRGMPDFYKTHAFSATVPTKRAYSRISINLQPPILLCQDAFCRQPKCSSGNNAVFHYLASSL